MPTGYTSDIAKGIDFKNFALNCAKAFGARTPIRDSENSEIPSLFEPSDHHKKKILRIEQGLTALDLMDDKQIKESNHRDWQIANTQRLNRRYDAVKLRNDYESMLRQVDDWKPPSSDHTRLKNFMRSQILNSIMFDCDENLHSIPIHKDPDEVWLVMLKSSLKKDLIYHKREHAQEVERANKRTKWVNDLRSSL